MRINIIGSGIGGMAAAIRLAASGHEVLVLEKNDYPGGKLSEMTLGKYRFDKGPSLFTMPELIDELTQLVGSKNDFPYHKLDTITHYFYEDGTTLCAYADLEKFAQEVHQKLHEDKQAIVKHLEKSRYYYQTTAKLFLHQSLHQLKNFLNLSTLKGILRSPRLNLFKTMHQANAARFSNAKTVQLFDRYATYNGSNPYKAPALLNIIPHLEFGLGAYLPQRGMHQITEHLMHLALEAGVQFKFGCAVDSIVVENDRVLGVQCQQQLIPSDLVVSDADIHQVYRRLLPEKYYPKKLLAQEKSSSAFVFYWGINRTFNHLGLHNIFFSENYREEFQHIFSGDSPGSDPTIYINITSKYCKEDAPEGGENWFVMINVPHHKAKTIEYAPALRAAVVAKINHILKVDIEKHIVEEATLDPIGIEQQTSSFGGSLYGNSSNNRFSAFLRHANYSSKIKGLYFVGGSVHPGGGIPLCLLSAKIATSIILEREK